jgi:hypothetical protein
VINRLQKDRIKLENTIDANHKADPDSTHLLYREVETLRNF